MIIKAIPSGYFRDFQDLKMILKSSFDGVLSINNMLKGIFSSIKINEDNMKKAVEQSFILALDLAELLVQEYNIPFRQSHEIVALLVKNAEKPEDIINKKKIEKFISEVTKNKVELSENLIHSLKNLDLCLEKRISQGSPSEENVKFFIDRLRKNKDSLYKLYENRLELVLKAKNLREKRINDLTS